MGRNHHVHAAHSSPREARDRKIEAKDARSVVRKMSIGENYVGKLTPMRSNISRFSRGTDPWRRPQMANLANFCNSEKSVKFFKIWWTRGDSNPRPPRCERGALPAELLAHEQQANFSKGAVACQHAFYCPLLPIRPKSYPAVSDPVASAGPALQGGVNEP